jgi:phospholipase C
VFVLTFDAHGGFYDHLHPPSVADDTVLPPGGPAPDLKRLGFRVPGIVMGPFAPARVVHSGPYEHCSILRMIEWRWDLPPMTARDRGAANLVDVLDFARPRPPLQIPPFDAGPVPQCSDADVKARIANGGL